MYSSQTINKGAIMFWDVYLNGKYIDSVWYTKECDAEYVRSSLINHDGYHYLIKVRKAK